MKQQFICKVIVIIAKFGIVIFPSCVPAQFIPQASKACDYCWHFYLYIWCMDTCKCLSGWDALFVVHAQVRKEQVDRYTHGRRIPSCQILVEWADNERRAVKSVHRVTLKGTKEPDSFFQIECKPITRSKSIRFICNTCALYIMGFVLISCVQIR